MDSTEMKATYPSAGDPASSRSVNPISTVSATTRPPSRHLVEAFQRENAGVPGTPEEERPRFNPLNTVRPRSSVLLNMNDAIAMHLLVETAILDSNDYEILSYEEVDDLKKEHALLVNRIDASRRKLVLESKVRDAAISLSRLYSPKSKVKQRRSLMSSNVNNGNSAPITEVMKLADDELAASNRKCEELAMEMWKLDVRAGELQRRLLQHTAGVLGMTHHDNRKSVSSTSGSSTFGSPKGHAYTLSNGRMPSTFRDTLIDEFDERSFYKTPDHLDEIPGSFVTNNKYYGGLGLYNNGRGMTDPRRTSTDNLVTPTSPRSGAKGKRSSSSGSLTSPNGLALAFTERRILELNTNVRNFLIQAGVQIPTSPSQPQAVSIPTVGVNGQRSNSSGAPFSTPILGGSPVFVVQEQLGLLEQGIKQIQKTAIDARAGATGHAAEAQRRLERTETILGSLWEVLLVGEEELRHKKRARQRRRDRREEQAELGDDDEDDLADDDSDGEDDPYEETDDEDEPILTNADEEDVDFTISTFSGKIHNLYERATRLHAERTSLRKHLAEQRTTNFQQIRLLKEEHDVQMAKVGKSLSVTKNELSLASEEQIKIVNGHNEHVMHMQNLLKEKADELQEAKEELGMVMKQLDSTRRELQLKENQHGFKDSDEVQKLRENYEELQQDLKIQVEEANRRGIDAEEKAEEIMKDADDRIEQNETKLTDLETDFREVTAKHTAANDLLRGREEMVTMLQGVIKELEEKLQTSSTAHASHEQAKAELDDFRARLSEHEELKRRLLEHEETVSTLRSTAVEGYENNLKTAEESEALQRSQVAEIQHLRTQLEQAKSEIMILTSQLDDHKDSAASRNAEILESEVGFKQRLDEKSAIVTSMEAELRALEGEVARLSTEVAILQAELDETHGTSKQRLEEVRRQAAAALQAEAGRPQAAMDPGLLMELEELSKKNQELLDEIKRLNEERDKLHSSNLTSSGIDADSIAREQALHKRCEGLQKELTEMLFDFETLTKTSIEFEAERGKLEILIDSLREKIEVLESNLADEKVRWLGVGSNNGNHARSPSVGINGLMTPGSSMGFGPSGENTSTTVLKSEFKKMMRDMRAEQTKLLRNEQELRRRLEGELRQLKKDHHQLQKQHSRAA